MFAPGETADLTAYLLAKRNALPSAAK